MTKTNWYVVYTKPRCELKVANLLTRKHIKNYCPVHIVENQLLDSRKTILQPLFPSYVFVCVAEQELSLVLNTQHIINYLYWLNKPAIITDDEIDSMFQLLKDYNNVKLEKVVIRLNRTLTSGETCQCLDHGSYSSSKQVKLALPSLGYCIIAVNGQKAFS